MAEFTDLSYDEWIDLLKPYGWADITTSCLPTLSGPPLMVRIEFRMVLWEDPETKLDEWTRRVVILETARKAVQTVQSKGFILEDPPYIEFGGQYRYRLDSSNPTWYGQAELRFAVYS